MTQPPIMYYRARPDLTVNDLPIFFGWIDQFFNKFAAHGDLEITQVEFETLLDHWTQGGQIPPLCWNPEQS